MKTYIEYLEQKQSECKAKMGELLSGFEYKKDKMQRLLDESNMINNWLRELKGYPKDTVGNQTQKVQNFQDMAKVHKRIFVNDKLSTKINDFLDSEGLDVNNIITIHESEAIGRLWYWK